MSKIIESLLKWLQTFDEISDNISAQQLCDGFLIAKVLATLGPEHFNPDWLAKIKGDISSDNWRVKVSNLRKILDKIVDWYTDVLNQNLSSWEAIPDVNAIGKDGDEEHLARLLQLLVGIAVQCERKKEYIGVIMRLEEQVQLDVMQAVQEIMIVNREGYQSLIFPDSLNTDQIQILKDELRKAIDDLNTANEARELADQRFFELDRMVKMLREEKENLMQENERLSQQTIDDSRYDDAGNPLDPSDASIKDRFYNKLRKRISALEEDLYKMEAQKEEYRAKNEILEKEFLEMRLKIEDLQSRAKEARALKDELDVLRHVSEKAEKYEQTIEMYKAKLEEMMDLKRQVKLLEERNNSLKEANVGLEEELKLSAAPKTQLELYKKQIHDLHQDVLVQSHRADQIEFDFKKLSDECESLKEEKNKLVQANSRLKKELKDFSPKSESNLLVNSGPKDNSKFLYDEINRHADQDEEDLREKVDKLEHEIEILRDKLKESDDEKVILLQTSLDYAKKRTRELEDENRQVNKNVIELKSQIKDLSDSLEVRNKEFESHKLANNISASELDQAHQRIKDLENILRKKDEEIVNIEAQHKKCANKARQAVRNVEPLSLPSSGSSSPLVSNSMSAPTEASSLDDVPVEVSRPTVIHQSQSENNGETIPLVERRSVASSPPPRPPPRTHNLLTTQVDNRMTINVITSPVSPPNTRPNESGVLDGSYKQSNFTRGSFRNNSLNLWSPFKRFNRDDHLNYLTASRNHPHSHSHPLYLHHVHIKEPPPPQPHHCPGQSMHSKGESEAEDNHLPGHDSKNDHICSNIAEDANDSAQKGNHSINNSTWYEYGCV